MPKNEGRSRIRSEGSGIHQAKLGSSWKALDIERPIAVASAADAERIGADDPTPAAEAGVFLIKSLEMVDRRLLRPSGFRNRQRHNRHQVGRRSMHWPGAAHCCFRIRHRRTATTTPALIAEALPRGRWGAEQGAG